MWKRTKKSEWQYVYRSANGSVTQIFPGYATETEARIGVSHFLSSDPLHWKAKSEKSWISELGDTLVVERS